MIARLNACPATDDNADNGKERVMPTKEYKVMQDKFKEILIEAYPNGVRAKTLTEQIQIRCALKRVDYGLDYIRKSIAEFERELSEFGKIRSEERGGGILYFYKNTEQVLSQEDLPPPHISVEQPLVAESRLQDRERDGQSSRKESDFYKSFAKYLEYAKSEDEDNDRLDECTKAVAWGGNRSGNIWGTPDVVGIFRPRSGTHVQFPHEIVSVEIKMGRTSQDLITAFGQACAYRLFSHKVYLVIPESGQNTDRIKSLCHLFGLGLVYFDPEVEIIDPSIYRTVLLAQSNTPDMFHVNKFITGELANKLYPD